MIYKIVVNFDVESDSADEAFEHVCRLITAAVGSGPTDNTPHEGLYNAPPSKEVH
ncbi:MAG: hypothetical protein DDT39_00017 [Firmicutes bacterium]|nr:hypothetical protein [candidate division NPL-UPA2 bacterium]